MTKEFEIKRRYHVYYNTEEKDVWVVSDYCKDGEFHARWSITKGLKQHEANNLRLHMTPAEFMGLAQTCYRVFKENYDADSLES